MHTHFSVCFSLLNSFRTSSLSIDGHSFTISAISSVARSTDAVVSVDDSHDLRERMAKSRRVVDQALSNGTSIYGISTGFGGSGKLLSYLKHPTTLSLNAWHQRTRAPKTSKILDLLCYNYCILAFYRPRFRRQSPKIRCRCSILSHPGSCPSPGCARQSSCASTP